MPRLSAVVRGAAAGRLPTRPVVLMYHGVRPGNAMPQWKWAVALDRFRDQIRLLQDTGWTTATVRDLAAGTANAPGTVALTFDDGYADNLDAVEALTQRGMRATWFVVTGAIGRHPTWSTDAPYGERLLDRAELRTMHAAGMEIGSHARQHRRLADMATSEVREELVVSRETLRSLLDVEVSSLAYPYGSLSDAVVGEARAAGYRAGCTTRSGRIQPGDDPLRMRRVTIYAGDDLAAFARKLALGDSDVGWRRMARYYTERLLARVPGRA